VVTTLDYRGYSDDIDLSVPFDRSPTTPADGISLEPILRWLLQDAGLTEEETRAADTRRLITRILTSRSARPIPPDPQRLLDELLATEAARRASVGIDGVLAAPGDGMTVAGTDVKVWRGDITTLRVDAIVNAANADLLGCFKPFHACIDNAIHSAAGPRLREDCRRIMERQGHKEPTGVAKITRAYYLPCRFVLHTVGPIVPDHRPTADDEAALVSCYQACLDLAAATGVKSLAFCSISTGVFGYPKADAAKVATRVVREWLERHPRVLELIVFDVFSRDDEEAYRQAFGTRGSNAPGSAPFDRDVQDIRRWIDEADRVLIGAGAGLSADAGVDYTDEVEFAAKYPALVKRGLRAAYQMIGNSELPPEVFWGYWLLHVHDVRFGDGRRRVYERLFELVGEKDVFVLTSNVDALFARNGFDASRVCSIQGDFAFLQCLTPCSSQLWPSEPVLERLLPEIDPDTQALRDASQSPTCPKCGGQVFFNVRGGGWFVEEPWRRQFGKLREWLPSAPNDRLLVLDIGSGFNTPGVVRWPMERVAEAIATSRFVRINRNEPHLDVALGDRALTMAARAIDVIQAVADISTGRKGRLGVNASS
jgi:O-acetyl-ADP-ribose deacetylase (regulator of RNase III)/NAD-dependent SIR2 family protein deacetylase